MATWDKQARDDYLKSHPENFAGQDGTFPIRDGEDIKNAAKLYGHSKAPDATKKKIVQIARRLKLTAALPDEWKADLNIKENGTISLEPRIIEGQDLKSRPDSPGHEVKVTVLQGGKSKNGYSYSANTLQSIANMLEGAHAYADHARNPADEANRSIRDIIGFYHNAQFIPASQNTIESTDGRVDATLHLFENADWLWNIVQESIALGRPELIGLSIDILGQWQHNQDTRAKDVNKVVALNSCDVVTRPSAGGSFQRILHNDDSQQFLSTLDENDQDEIEDEDEGEHQAMDPKKLENLPAVPNAVQPAAPPAADGAPVAATITESQAQPNTQAQPAATTTTITPITENQQAQPAATTTALATIQAQQVQQTQAQNQQAQQQDIRITEQSQQMQSLMQELRQERAAAYLEQSLGTSILPEPVKNKVRAMFTGRVFENQELDGEISRHIDMLAELTNAGLIRGNGYEKPSAITNMISESEKVQAAFDRMFDLDIDTAKLGNIRGFGGILEAYKRVTGDSSVAGGISGNSMIGQIRVSESAPITRISEADTTTASFSYLLGTSMNKRLLKDYQAWPAEWMKFCTVAPIRDFKQQVRVRFGAFGSLPIVPEDTAYTAVSLIDSAATYVPQKRGNLVTVSREVIINDDLMAVKQVPTKLAVAAAYTLAEFVYAFFINNPTIYDGNALFTSGGGSHLNLGSTALSSNGMQLGVTAMREQTNYAGKRIGLRPRFLIVPPELEWVAMVATRSAGVPGSASNDINPMLGYVTPIVSAQLTSTTQWFMAADPREIDTLEVGFVGGQMNPQLYVQDQPSSHMLAKAA